MASKALDFATMAHALQVLERTFLKGYVWYGVTPDQRRFLNWWRTRHDDVTLLSRLEALASTSTTELNEFLAAHGFEPQFEPDKEGVGVASILDMLIEWAVPAQDTTIRARVDDQSVEFPAFQVSTGGATLYCVDGYEWPLVELLTKSGDSLWLMMHDDPGSGLELAILADCIMRQSRELDTRRSGVVVPKVDLQTEPDLEWMFGLTAFAPDRDDFEVTQASQQFKLRINQEGARAKVATRFFLTRGAALAPEPLRIDRPFIGFFTQKGVPLPIAAFWADFDSWVEPTGSLADM